MKQLIPEAKHRGRSRGRERTNQVLSVCTASASEAAVSHAERKRQTLDLEW